MEQYNWERLLKVAIGGAVSAVVADYMYTNYGKEAREIIAEIIKLMTQGDISDYPGSDRGAPA